MDYLLLDRAEQHRADLLSEAEARHATHRRSVARQQHAQAALAWLGERFIAWGWRLRARYGKVEHRAAL
ncbi:MAG TPA: hypothetical protein VFT66_19090 [Roseiflexaceae bacterium]|nr:hypothetical protein [Roseiflexaceae bacterium]